MVEKKYCFETHHIGRFSHLETIKCAVLVSFFIKKDYIAKTTIRVSVMNQISRSEGAGNEKNCKTEEIIVYISSSFKNSKHLSFGKTAHYIL